MMGSTLFCWCGNGDLDDFSQDYARCPRCETLIWKRTNTDLSAQVVSEEEDFYGRNYFLSHQNEMGLPDLYERARSDLLDRCPHWLSALMKYRLPPGRALEIGSSHGAFTALLGWAGFEASGLELSPWVVGFSQKAFGIQAQVGLIEQQTYAPGSFDVLILMDVIEHLPNPLKTLRTCAQMLTPDGLLMVQTPCYLEGASLKALEGENSLFLRMLMPREHLYLYSQTSARQLAASAGLPNMVFEPSVFAGQDMFFFASHQPLHETAPAAQLAVLQSRNTGRFVQGLLDQANLLKKLNQQLEIVESDRAARLDQINQLTAVIRGLEAELQKRNSLSHTFLNKIRRLWAKG
jgi:2-polyprenyl-3-methyl-5-hydroxy-6-metoxy-1,4-benzoquinol methylase